MLKRSVLLAVLLIACGCLCSCSSIFRELLWDDYSLRKPDHLTFRSDILISKNYDTITVKNAEYGIAQVSDSEIYIPPDVKMYEVLADGETFEDKEKSGEFDIVYLSESCPDYIWFISSKDIDNDVVIIISGCTELYEKKEKI